MQVCLLLWPSRGSSRHFFLHILVCVSCQGMTCMHTVFIWSFTAFESNKPLIPISLSQKAFSDTHCIFDAVSKFEAEKGKVVLVRSMKACRRSRVVAPLILNYWKVPSGKLHAQVASPQEEPQYPLRTRLGGSESQFECSGEEKNSLASFQDFKNGLASQTLVSVPSMLSWLFLKQNLT